MDPHNQKYKRERWGNLGIPHYLIVICFLNEHGLYNGYLLITRYMPYMVVDVYTIII